MGSITPIGLGLVFLFLLESFRPQARRKGARLRAAHQRTAVGRHLQGRVESTEDLVPHYQEEQESSQLRGSSIYRFSVFWFTALGKGESDIEKRNKRTLNPLLFHVLPLTGTFSARTFSDRECIPIRELGQKIGHRMYPFRS